MPAHCGSENRDEPPGRPKVGHVHVRIMPLHANTGGIFNEHKLLGITAMQKLLGKARFEDLLSPYIEKPPGKPTLVPDSDDRPAMNTAKNDFMEEYDNE